jgi:cyclase
VQLQNSRLRQVLLLVSIYSTYSTLATAQPVVSQIGKGLYAYISDNDASANSTFLVGDAGVLVVDTGLNETEGSKLLAAIRRVSGLPVKYVVNTHYHPDHQGGNAVVGPSATVISTDFTRVRTLALQKDPGMKAFHFEPADLTFQQQVTLHLEPYTARVYFPGKAHTSGDALVYFPEQQAISMGDLFLNRSSPAMDDGSVESWIHALDHVLELPLENVVPGHFELATRPELRRFRDYLNDLYEQVRTLKQKGETLEQVRHDIRMEKYADFRQYPKYEATFADNAATIYQQIQTH